MPAPTNSVEYARAVRRVKRRVARWPSAYASGMVVREYKKAMEASGRPAYTTSESPSPSTGLTRWFAEKWIDILTGKPCGSAHTPGTPGTSGTPGYYPTCRPSKRITKKSPVTSGEISARNKLKMILQKQRAQSNTVHYATTRRRRKQAKGTTRPG